MDESTFADAKKASDGFEHSFLDFALKAFSRDGKIMTFTPEENPTARFSADVLLENLRFEGWTADGVNITSTQTDPANPRL